MINKKIGLVVLSENGQGKSARQEDQYRPATFCRSGAVRYRDASGLGRRLGGNFIELLRICSRGFWMRLFPKPLGDLQRFEVEVSPPGHLVAGLMQLPVMPAAERNGELVADFESNGSGLCKPQVMRVAGLTTTYETGL